MADAATLKIILLYYFVSVPILLTGHFYSAATEFVTYLPILLSVLLLIPIYIWQRNYRKKTKLSMETSGRDKGSVLFWIFTLFTLALSIRIPSALLFGVPYEKTPLIYLLILTTLIIEKTDLTTFGFKTENMRRSLLYGLIFFAILAGLAQTIFYTLIYGFVGQMPIQSYDVISSFLTMPFMTLCVGISEEGLFRGYIQTHLEKIYSSKQAILTQAVLFGGWHFVWNLSPFDSLGMAKYIVTTFFIGLLFGYFYSKTRNLVPLVLAHGLWDSIPPWIIENQKAMSCFSTFPMEDQLLVLILPLTISAIATVFFIKYLGKKSTVLER